MLSNFSDPIASTERVAFGAGLEVLREREGDPASEDDEVGFATPLKELWLQILNLSLYQPEGKCLATVSVVCKQWSLLCSELKRRLIDDGIPLNDLFSSIGEDQLQEELEKQPSILSLDIRETPISSLYLFTQIQMANLSQLDISITSISDLRPLKHLKNLRILHANQLESLDLKPLRDVASLEELFLEYSGVEGLEHLGGLLKLKKLDLLGNNRVSDLSPLARLTALEILYLQGTQINSGAQLSAIEHINFKRLVVNEKIETHAICIILAAEFRLRNMGS